MRPAPPGGSEAWRGLDGEKAAEVLDILGAADGLDDLPKLASYGLHKLRRGRKGQWSITVNLPWVVCVTPARGGGWPDVEITDYH